MSFRSRAIAIAFVTTSAAGVAGAQLGSATTPLPESAGQTLEAIPHENTEPPEEHYYRSNEWRQDLLREHLAGLGGALIGVGADQNYTLAAMAGSDLVFLVGLRSAHSVDP